MCAIFLNRQDSGHVGKMNIRLVLQEIPQEIKILFLRFMVLAIFPENAVPFINNNHKRTFRLLVNILHCPAKIFFIKIINIRIFKKQIP